MTGPDVEGVLAGHQAGSTTFCTGCDWRPEDGRSEAVLVDPAHVAAVLREQIAAWLVAEADWRWEPDSEIPAVLAELAAKVACVDPSRSDGGSTDPEVRQSADRTSSPSRVPGEDS